MSLSRLVAWLKKPARRPVRRRSDHRTRPWLEVLEDRCVPTVYNLVVDTNSDYAVPNPGNTSAAHQYDPLTGLVPAGLVSLRQAIYLANNLAPIGSGNTAVISFSHTVYSVGDVNPLTGTSQSTDLGRNGEIVLDDLSTNSQTGVYLPLVYSFLAPDGNSYTVQAADAPLPTITSNVIIDGQRIGNNPMVIDGGSAPKVPARGVGVFTIGNGATVEIENFRIQNADSNTTLIPTTLRAGNVIIAPSTGKNITIPATFSTSSGYYSGGTGAAVSNGTMSAGGGTVTLLNDQFNNTVAQFGSALFNASGDSMTVQNCTFQSNDGAPDNELSPDEPPNKAPALPGQGGGIYNAGTLTFLGATNSFNSDYAPSAGGAIYNASTGTMNVGGSTVSITVAQAFSGGGIYNAGTISGSMTGWTFSDDIAYNQGGAIWNNSSSPLTLTNDTFTSNGADRHGGAIFNSGSGAVSVSGGTFMTNTAQNSGGAIYNTGTMTVTGTSAANVAFTNNTALFKGGTIWNSGSLSLTFATISGTANSYGAATGGAVYTTSGNVSLSNDTFNTNSAGGNPLGAGAGGGLFVGSGTVTLGNVTFSGNQATDPSTQHPGGGAIYVNGGSVTVTGSSSFKGNQAISGGAVYVGGGSFTATSGVTFGTSTAGNVATAKGGAIFAKGGTLSVQRGTFTGNSAASGGALYQGGGTGSLQTDTFTSNTASAKGGAIYDQAILNALASSLIGNTAASGGGIYNAGSSTLSNSTLANNSATRGGGAYNAGALSFVNATISFNGATATGGGIYNAATLSLLNTIVAGNSAPVGPDIYNPSNTAAFVNSLYQDLLGRPADPGAAGWVTALNNGVSPSAVVQGIEASTEYLQDQVKGFYLKYLGRQADAGGLAAYTSFLANGGTFEQVIAALVSSPEYFSLQSSNNAVFVAALYSQILGRNGSVAEVNAWVAAINGGMTRGQVAATFLTSQEYLSNLVGSYYQTYLGRAADPTGLSAWVAQLSAGVPDQNVLAAIAGSAEGFNKLGGGGNFSLLMNNLIGNNTNSGIGTNIGNGNLVGTASAPISPNYSSNTPASVNGSPPVLSPATGSPAIDTGTSIVLNAPYNLTTDEVGNPRLRGLSVDIGAVEAAAQNNGPPGTNTVATADFEVPPLTPTPFSTAQVLSALGISYPASLTGFQIVTTPSASLGSVSSPNGTTLSITVLSRSGFAFIFQLNYYNSSGQLVGNSGLLYGQVFTTTGPGLVVHG